MSRAWEIIKMCESEMDDAHHQMYVDNIETTIANKDKEGEARMRALYKKRYSKEYVPNIFDPRPDLDRVYSQEDFPRYKDYKKYASQLFVLKFKTYKNLLNKKTPKPLSWESLKTFLFKLGVTSVPGKPHGTEEMWVVDDRKIIVKEKYLKKPIPVEMIIHELAHVFENRQTIKVLNTDMFLHNRASSNYDLNPSEIFAEAFINYFINPKFLKAGWSETFSYFDRVIPLKWKKEIKFILK